MRYEDMVRQICGEDWNTVNQQEMEGGYGVAIMIAFLRGCHTSIADFANHLEVAPDQIATSYNRLSYNGVFHRNWGAKKDEGLLGRSEDHHDSEIAWSHIAAISGGFLGLL